MTDADAEFGALLRRARDDAGLSTAWIAEQLHVARETADRYMRGDRRPDEKVVAQWEALCRVEGDSLLNAYKSLPPRRASTGEEPEPQAAQTAPLAPLHVVLDRRGEGGSRLGRRGRPWTRRRRSAALLGLPIVALAVMNNVPRFGGQGVPTRTDGPDLRAVDLTVLDDPSRLDIKLHNVGTRRLVLTRARVSVLAVVRLPLCYSQGGLGVTGHYDVTLPARTGSVEVHLHQQLGPDEADRFRLAVGTSKNNLQISTPATAASPARLRSLVYRLRVAIFHDGAATPIDLGEALVSVPSAPDEVEHFWPKALETKSQTELQTMYGWERLDRASMTCWRTNTSRLRRMLGSGGSRSPELAAVRARLADRVELPR